MDGRQAVMRSDAAVARIEDLDHPFTTDYFGGPHTFDESERIRLSLMTVEMPGRAMADPARGERLTRLLAGEPAALRSAPE